MSTRIFKAQQGFLSDEIQKIARKENISAKFIKDELCAGRIAIIRNKKKNNIAPLVLGNKIRTKVCADIISDFDDFAIENKADKIRVIQTAKADCIIDMTASGVDVDNNSVEISKIPYGISSVVQACCQTIKEFGTVANLTKEDLFSLIDTHCYCGADFLYLPCSLNLELLNEHNNSNKLLKYSSPSVEFISNWMQLTNCENPLYEYFDELLDILAEYDVALFFETSTKSGSVLDSFDSIQLKEYALIATLTKKAISRGVQVVVDGIGYVSLEKIEYFIKTVKEITNNIPLYISSAFVCDAVVEHHNIVNNLGSLICAKFGANMLNSTARMDYSQKYKPFQIKEGIVSSKIVAHSADLANQNVFASKQSYKYSYAKKNVDEKNILKNALDKTTFDEH